MNARLNGAGGLTAVLLAALLVPALRPVPAIAADDCTRECRAETAACIASRCTSLRGPAKRECRANCKGSVGCTRVSTLAYVVTECRSDARGIVGRQTLQVRRGNCAPVTVMEVSREVPAPDPFGLCRLFGDVRLGQQSLVAGSFDRITVSPDGSGVVFEITDDRAYFPLLPVSPEREGIYFVGADGGGLRKLAPASRVPTFEAEADPRVTGLGLTFNHYVARGFSPDGRRFAFADLGPGPLGEEAPQIFVLDIASGARAQVTRLPPPPSPAPVVVRFVDNERIFFATTANPDGLNPGGEYGRFHVSPRGTGLEMLPLPVAAAGARFVPRFGLVGGRGMAVYTFALPGTPVDVEAEAIWEVFALVGKRSVQLTNFRRSDTAAVSTSRGGRRVFFVAAADPFGDNPSNNCQLFSIDPLGGHLRQLTRFSEAPRSTNGCAAYAEPGCMIWGVAGTDATTGAVLFYSSCDPFRTGFFGGQVFAIRPSGAGLRQLTRTRGMAIGDDGSVTVEMPGPFAWAGRS